MTVADTTLEIKGLDTPQAALNGAAIGGGLAYAAAGLAGIVATGLLISQSRYVDALIVFTFTNAAFSAVGIASKILQSGFFKHEGEFRNPEAGVVFGGTMVASLAVAGLIACQSVPYAEDTLVAARNFLIAPHMK